jgi:hypothetical protein
MLLFSNREILWEKAVVEDFAEYRAHFRQHQLMTDIERLFKPSLPDEAGEPGTIAGFGE